MLKERPGVMEKVEFEKAKAGEALDLLKSSRLDAIGDPVQVAYYNSEISKTTDYIRTLEGEYQQLNEASNTYFSGNYSGL